MKELKKAYVLDERSRDPDLQPIITKPEACLNEYNN